MSIGSSAKSRRGAFKTARLLFSGKIEAGLWSENARFADDAWSILKSAAALADPRVVLS